MKDVSLEAYVEGIEGHFRARRGADHVLTPRDFALARSWHAAGLPLATVLVGIDRAFESGSDASSLAYCRQGVEELASAGPRPQVRPAPPPEVVPLGELAGILETLHDRLRQLSPGPRACFEPPLRKIREVQDLVAVAARPNWDYLRAKLREIDDDVSAAVLEALPAPEAAGFRSGARRTLERLRGRVDDASIEDAITRYLVQRAREKLGLPRVSLV